MKHLIFTALLLTGISSAAQAVKPVDYRRTLFVPVDQKIMRFEAPAHMCFLDRTSLRESALYDYFREKMEKKGDRVLLAVFGDCAAVTNFGRGAVPEDAASDLRFNAGTITWLNPMVGRTTGFSRSDYLDMRESALTDYARVSPVFEKDFAVDRDAFRSPSGIGIGMHGTLDIEGDLRPAQVLLGTTEVRAVPLEFTLTFSREDLPVLAQTKDLLAALMAQQIALNE